MRRAAKPRDASLDMSTLVSASAPVFLPRGSRTSHRVSPRAAASVTRNRWLAGAAGGKQRKTSSRPRSSSDDEATASASSSIDALDKLLGSMDEADLPPSARPSAREDPFADYAPPTAPADDSAEERARSGKGASGSGSFGGRRVNSDRTELDDFLDVGMRFEGLWTLLRAISKGSVLNTDLGNVEVGELVVVGTDKPSLQLWEAQAYELTRVYYQRTTDELGTRRVDVDSLGESPPQRMYAYEEEALGKDGGGGDWILYCELFSEEYHSSPVRVRPEEVGLRTVGAEIGEALFIAVPVAFFWAAVSASFVVTSLGR